QAGGAVSELPAARREGRGAAGRVSRRDPGKLRPGHLDRGHRPLSRRPVRGRAAAGEVPLQVPGRSGAAGPDPVNLGQLFSWGGFVAALASGLSFMAAMGGREQAWRPARVAFRIQWLALIGATAFLWSIIFTHQFQYQYVASYSSRAMPGPYLYAAFWG